MPNKPRPGCGVGDKCEHWVSKKVNPNPPASRCDIYENKLDCPRCRQNIKKVKAHQAYMIKKAGGPKAWELRNQWR